MFAVKFCLLFFSVLATLAIGYITEKTSADGPWSHVVASKEKTYYVSLNPVCVYNETKAICEKYNLRVLTLESKEEYKRVLDLLNNELNITYSIFWTAGTRLQGDKVLDYWIWETTQENITFFDWGGDQPNNNETGKDCIQITYNPRNLTGNWNNFYCGNYDVLVLPICETY